MAVTITAAAGYAAIASLRPSTTQAANARGAVDELASTLRMARQTAIAKQRPVEVRLAAVASGQWVEQMVTGGGLTLTQPIIVPLVAPPGVSVRGWPGSIRFDASGTANRSLDLGVGFTGREYRLRLYQASGVIRINRP
ncbi:GspH/FimT family protein [Planctomycetaceae bacterium SH139]